MTMDESARIIESINHVLINSFTEQPQGILLYAELARNMVGPSVFELRDNDILFHWPSNELTYPLLDLWELDGEDKHWDAIEYVIRNRSFSVRFTHPEDFDRNEDEGLRRDRAVWRNFGQLPIVYPPWPEDKNEDFVLGGT